ncbi:glycosyltransferase [Gelidibacter sp. F2691]|nr:glycosyltransferase [Gelidibacter sp. F2691]
MPEQPLVSIIIPTYNRIQVIGETLDSVLAQTYTNWECIVVDDGSTDGTETLLTSFLRKDDRIQYHKRPKRHLPGGNGARNYGFSLSKGDYIQWFDSDDLMVPEKLALKVKAMLKHNVDFVISKTKYFNRQNNTFSNYDFKFSEVTFESYAIDYIGWYTPDLFVKRAVVSSITYNEHLTAGQEYNFNCKLLLKTNNLVFLDAFLTLRRYSVNSIGGQRAQSPQLHQIKLFEAHWHNYRDLKIAANSSKFNRYSLLQCVHAYLKSANKISLPYNFITELKSAFPNRYYFFYMARISNMIFGRYYRFYSLLKQNEVFNTYGAKK